jgi:hypothetical protein
MLINDTESSSDTDIGSDDDSEAGSSFASIPLDVSLSIGRSIVGEFEEPLQPQPSTKAEPPPPPCCNDWVLMGAFCSLAVVGVVVYWQLAARWN